MKVRTAYLELRLPYSWGLFIVVIFLFFFLVECAAGAPPDWEKILVDSEQYLRDGRTAEATSSLQHVLNLDAESLEKARISRERAANLSLRLANLLAEAFQVEEADNYYHMAIKTADSGSDLQFRARNDFAVFLLATGRLNLAEKELAPMEQTIQGKSRLLRARYLYNYGKTLELKGDTERALKRYLGSIEADPRFRPASDAARQAALDSKSPALGVNAIHELVKNALARFDFDGAASHLHEALKRADWATAENFPDLLTSLVRLLTQSEVDVESFQTSWAKPLEDLRSAVGESVVTARIESVFQIYFHEVPFCLEPPNYDRLHSVDDTNAFSTDMLYRAWRPADDTIAFTDFVQMMADYQLREGRVPSAIARYLLATCLAWEEEEPSTRLAYALLQHPRLATEIQNTIKSHKIMAAIGWGYRQLERPAEAAASFMRTAELLVPTGDAEAIDSFMRYAIDLWPGRSVELASRGGELIAEVGRQTEQVTVTGIQASGYRVEDFLSLPVSRGSLSIAGFIQPQSLSSSSHLSLATSESGQNEIGIFSGASLRNNVLKADHATIDGPPALESPTAYYPLMALAAIDLAEETANSELSWNGLHVNLVTKHPGDRWESSATYALLPGLVQGEHTQGALDLAESQVVAEANQLQENNEYGAEVGGPLWGQHIWLWGSYGKSDLAGLALEGDPFSNRVSDATFKLDASPLISDSLSFSFSRKDQHSEGLGASGNRSRETTLTKKGETNFWRLEYERFARDWSLFGLYSRTDGNYSSGPEGRVTSDILIDSKGVWRGGFRSDRLLSATDDWHVDTTITQGLTTSETPLWQWKFGADVRESRSVISSAFGHSNSISIAGENLASDLHVLRFYRTGRAEVKTKHSAAWIQQTFRGKYLTVDLGGRYDKQLAENRGAMADANPIMADLLHALRHADPEDLNWSSFSPRVGLTYSLDGRVIRLTYSRFASPLQLEYILRTNAASPVYAQFGFSDQNGNGFLDNDEAQSLRLLSSSGFDPILPGAGSSNRNSPDLKPEMMNELMLAIDIPLFKTTTFTFSAMLRRATDILELRDFVRDGDSIRLSTHSDFVLSSRLPITLPGGRNTWVDSYTLRPDLTFTGGSLLTNGDREQEFLDFRAHFWSGMGKRGKWHGSIAYHRSRWNIGHNFRLFNDPTDVAQDYDPSGISQADSHGDVVAVHPARPTASDNPFLQSRWAANLNGTFKLPAKVLFGTNMNFYEGLPLPYFATILTEDGVERQVQAASRSDSFLLPDLWVIDLRFERAFNFRDFEATGSLDCFNVLNRATPLERNLQLNGPQPDFLLRTLNPRTVRLGLRLRWRA